MNLYLISQDKNTGWDTYDSAVVAAESAEDAIEIGPSKWVDTDHPWGLWVSKEYVQVRLLGKATDTIERGVVCASFNAG